jgi:hypothetical protein
MDPISIIVSGLVIAAICVVIFLAWPKIKKQFEDRQKNERAIEQYLVSNSYKVEKPQKGDIRWIIHGSNWQIAFDSDFSSDQSSPKLKLTSDIKTSPENRFLIVTETGLATLNNPTTRKMLGAATGLAQRFTKIPVAENFEELFEIIDKKFTLDFAETSKQKLIIAAASSKALNSLKNSDLRSKVSQVLALEKSPLPDSTARVGRFSNRTQAAIYTTYPTIEQLKAMVELAETLVNLPS